MSELIERCRNETLDWAAALARRYNCLLVMGHPRKEEDGAELYNSQVCSELLYAMCACLFIRGSIVSSGCLQARW